ncbi:hypothetical protein PR202_gb28253 [Eleusine coracana subsp. coracana]|uniref:Uncharacterized protein n=1 Tax=Eleusine coracana subsp. coracana TaxID=191504 RepID=A0AAV5FWC7_ELECO|nr:hypothetical protein PR202_gb28253 [Eleusine coracana subsp. coracana]
MEEDPLIPLVHVWNNAAFDNTSSASAWHAHTAVAGREGDKENHRPEPAADVDAEIDHIEAEILRLSSRLHHLRCAQQPEVAQPAAKASRPRTRGLSLGPLDIAAANPRVPAAAPPPIKERAARSILKPIKEPPVQRRRGVSLGPLEIHHGVSSKPGATTAARVKPFANKLSSVREEGQHSKQRAVPAKPWPSSNARQARMPSKGHKGQ